MPFHTLALALRGGVPDTTGVGSGVRVVLLRTGGGGGSGVDVASLTRAIDAVAVAVATSASELAAGEADGT